MLCKACKKKIDEIDLYCKYCGTPSEAYRQQFSAKAVLKAAKESSQKDTEYPLALPLAVMVVIIAIIYIFNFDVLSDNAWINYIGLNLSLILVVPVLMISLNKTPNSSLFTPHYFRLLLFTSLIALYFFILKLICQGDPILNIVRLVLVLWGLAIAFPVPYLIFKRDENVFKLIYKAYLAGKYMRWKQFFIYFVLGLMNLAATLGLLILLPKSLHYTAHTMNVWYQRQEKFKLYDKEKDY